MVESGYVYLDLVRRGVLGTRMAITFVRATDVWRNSKTIRLGVPVEASLPMAVLPMSTNIV